MAERVEAVSLETVRHGGHTAARIRGFFDEHLYLSQCHCRLSFHEGSLGEKPPFILLVKNTNAGLGPVDGLCPERNSFGWLTVRDHRPGQ